MANYRQIHVSIWKDPWFMDLEPEQKLLFIYLFSNESASLAGIYEIPFKVICFETCLDPEFVANTLEYFKQIEKVHYDNGVIWVRNLRKYNASPSSKVQIRVKSDIDKIPECPIKQKYITYHYPTDTLSYEMKNNESEMECNENKDSLSIVSNLYEQEIGPLTPLIGEQIKDWIDNYPVNWLEKAVEIATKKQARNVGYINGVLKNFKLHGFDNNRGDKEDEDDGIDMQEVREKEAKETRERIEKGRKEKESTNE